MRIRLLGKHYDLRFVTRLGNGGKGHDGTCDHPEKPGKRIRIRRGQHEFEELDTVIHECLHAADWHKDEQWVAEFASDLTEVLKKLGWRKT